MTRSLLEPVEAPVCFVGGSAELAQVCHQRLIDIGAQSAEGVVVRFLQVLQGVEGPRELVAVRRKLVEAHSESSAVGLQCDRKPVAVLRLQVRQQVQRLQELVALRLQVLLSVESRGELVSVRRLAVLEGVKACGEQVLVRLLPLRESAELVAELREGA